MTASILIGCVLLGAALGSLGGLLGTGGGTFAIPALVLMMGYDQKLAQGTALVMVVGNVIKALLRYRHHSGLDLKLATLLAVTGSAASAISAHYSLQMSAERLQQFYGIFLLTLAAFVFLTHRSAAAKEAKPWQWAAIPGLIGGTSLGLFGVGGAMLAVPMLVLFHGQSQIRAQGLGLALAVPGCAITLAQYTASGQVQWIPAIALAAGGLIGVSPGVALAHRIPAQMLTKIFCLFLVVASLIMLQ